MLISSVRYWQRQRRWTPCVSVRCAARNCPRAWAKKWSEEEEQQLKIEFAEGEPLSTIATKHRRTVRAIEDRLQRLGLLQSDQHTTQNSFLSSSGAKEHK